MTPETTVTANPAHPAGDDEVPLTEDVLADGGSASGGDAQLGAVCRDDDSGRGSDYRRVIRHGVSRKSRQPNPATRTAA
ncbi:hypothetical protein HSR121_1612 [Halapricum desulfuricans]|uniref:Uncharacterized protein n=1 Tax=Halapricum desulfuricans TaxID=2841257 RepID=A0A897N4E9_9EURY|nr:hypothetical protein HSR121_1612 [Halapricum desulfuricans]